jgi:hypothetical protein
MHAKMSTSIESAKFLDLDKIILNSLRKVDKIDLRNTVRFC